LPQVNPVWFIWDGEHILLSVKADTQKYRNLRRDPHVAISFPDLARRERYVEIRGEVVEFELYEKLTVVNQLAREYTGADYQHSYPGEHRYKLTIQVNSWTGQG
jgi:PPOX class probable F420-dependent enzyme